MGRLGQAGTREACPVQDGEQAVSGQQEALAADVLTRPVTRPRVLVVDDEEAIRSALSRALAAEGLLIDLAENGADGLRRALDEGYDLVILDLLMPGTDGFAVLRQLLRDRDRKSTRLNSSHMSISYA